MYIIAIVIAIIIIAVIIIYNTMLSKKNKLLKAYSSLDVMLKKRYDLIPNIVDTVKAYANYEKGTLEKIMGIRKRADDCKDIEDLVNVSDDFNNFMGDISLLFEKYPDLKAGENFMHLQKVLNEIEEQISAARRTYNAHVENYNTYISFIPLNIFAKLFNFKKFDFFEINENEKNSKIWFNENNK